MTVRHNNHNEEIVVTDRGGTKILKNTTTNRDKNQSAQKSGEQELITDPNLTNPRPTDQSPLDPNDNRQTLKNSVNPYLQANLKASMKVRKGKNGQ